MTITNHASGQITFDVTDDVLAGAENGWLVTRDADVGSQVAFYSREGAAAASDNMLAPYLILEFDGQSAQAWPSLLHRLIGLVEIAWERMSGAQVGGFSTYRPRG